MPIHSRNHFPLFRREGTPYARAALRTSRAAVPASEEHGAVSIFLPVAGVPGEILTQSGLANWVKDVFDGRQEVRGAKLVAFATAIRESVSFPLAAMETNAEVRDAYGRLSEHREAMKKGVMDLYFAAKPLIGRNFTDRPRLEQILHQLIATRTVVEQPTLRQNILERLSLPVTEAHSVAVKAHLIEEIDLLRANLGTKSEPTVEMPAVAPDQLERFRNAVREAGKYIALSKRESRAAAIGVGILMTIASSAMFQSSPVCGVLGVLMSAMVAFWGIRGIRVFARFKRRADPSHPCRRFGDTQLRTLIDLENNHAKLEVALSEFDTIVGAAKKNGFVMTQPVEAIVDQIQAERTGVMGKGLAFLAKISSFTILTSQETNKAEKDVTGFLNTVNYAIDLFRQGLFGIKA